jgi:hypothetical protein
MDTPQTTDERNRKQYVLEWAWKQQLLRGLPKTIREVFNAGFDFGFRCGLKKGREQGAATRQLKIPST